MQIRCRICSKECTWENNPNRPFCSLECKQRDLGNWADERYRVPVEHETPPDTPTSPAKKSGEDED